MTIHDFIVIYNETFKYIAKRYGGEAVEGLWATISKQWCTHLDLLVREKGLEGMLEYWGGNDGTLGREKAEYEVSLTDGMFSGTMHRCPSVGELVKRGREIYQGKRTYCDHCAALYAPVADKYGYKMEFCIKYDDTGKCTGQCAWEVYRRA